MDFAKFMVLRTFILYFPRFSIFPTSHKTVPFGSVTTNELCICIRYEVGTLRLTDFHQQVSGSRLPNRTYTSQRIRLSMNHLDSLVSCKSSKQSGQSARDFLRISNIFFSNISLPFSDFSVLTWCIHKYSACSPHISHFPALIRLISKRQIRTCSEIFSFLL